MRAVVTGVSGFVGGHLAEHLVAEGDLVVGLSASGRWPAELAHLGKSMRIEQVRPGRTGRGRPGRAVAPQAARGDLSSGRAVQSTGESGRPARHLGPQPGGEPEPARGGQGCRAKSLGWSWSARGSVMATRRPNSFRSGKTAHCVRTTLMQRARLRSTCSGSSTTWRTAPTS